MLFKRDASSQNVQEGSVFRRVKSYYLIERARVLSVDTDCHGIPHVRYEVSFEGPYRGHACDGPRLMSLKSFTEYYPEPVGA